jgi:hypothetical protein
MRITESQLRRIVREEIKSLNEAWYDPTTWFGDKKKKPGAAPAAGKEAAKPAAAAPAKLTDSQLSTIERFLQSRKDAALANYLFTDPAFMNKDGTPNQRMHQLAYGYIRDNALKDFMPAFGDTYEEARETKGKARQYVMSAGSSKKDDDAFMNKVTGGVRY